PRGSTAATTSPGGGDEMSKDGVDRPPPPGVLAEIREVVGRAKGGDAAAVPRLRELLDGHPSLWKTYGDLAAQVERSWLALAGGGDLHLLATAARYAAGLRAQLTRPAASPV